METQENTFTLKSFLRKHGSSWTDALFLILRRCFSFLGLTRVFRANPPCCAVCCSVVGWSSHWDGQSTASLPTCFSKEREAGRVPSSRHTHTHTHTHTGDISATLNETWGHVHDPSTFPDIRPAVTHRGSSPSAVELTLFTCDYWCH